MLYNVNFYRSLHFVVQQNNSLLAAHNDSKAGNGNIPGPGVGHRVRIRNIFYISN